jgi:hypothetical protein
MSALPGYRGVARVLRAIPFFAWCLLGPAIALCSDDDFPAELVRFEPATKSLVFTAGPAEAWDAKIRERGWIMRERDTWRLWYTGYDGTPGVTMKLGYATSKDGLSWTRWSANPIYQQHWVEDMMIVRDGDRYLMFAEGLNDEAQLLTSPDGLTWTREGKLDVRTTDGKPLTAGPFGTPAAWFENGSWNLFYERGDEGIWLARSSDLKVWTNVRDEPVLSPGPGPYDAIYVAMNQIVKHGGRYYAYYHGSGSKERPRLWTTNVAVSNDLIHWRKFSGNPLLPERDNKSSGILVHDGTQYRLYTMHNQVHVHFPRAK